MQLKRFGGCYIYVSGKTKMICIPGYFPVDCCLLNENSDDLEESVLTKVLQLHYNGRWYISALFESEEQRPSIEVERGLVTPSGMYALYQEHPEGITLEHCFDKIKSALRVWADKS